MLRSLSIICLIQSTTKSMSSMVVSADSVRRREPCAISCGRPIASSTWDGSREPDVQADPLEAQIPLLSSRDQKGLTFYKLKTEVCIVRQTVGSVSVQSGIRNFRQNTVDQMISQFDPLLRYALSWSLLRFLLPCRTPQYQEHFPYRHDVYAPVLRRVRKNGS